MSVTLLHVVVVGLMLTAAWVARRAIRFLGPEIAVSLAWVTIAVVGGVVVIDATSAQADTCVFEPELGRLVCEVGGVDQPPPGLPGRPDDPGKRYVYTDTDPAVGDCHYWSDVPGGLDAWDPANDPAVIAITTSLPECPVAIADAEARAWEIFRSWDLDTPDPTMTPAIGITGIATILTTTDPPSIIHEEGLPDGRSLRVRARIALMSVDWGDGHVSEHDVPFADPTSADAATHMYGQKTCSADYRRSHPSGRLCHPSLVAYPITASFVWVGEYSLGSGWVAIGTLTTTAAVDYDVDEVRGVASR